MIQDTKVYSITFRDSRGYALTKLQHDLFHGVRCLKGISRSPKNDHWIEGKYVYIPVDQICAIVEFDSWNDFTAACKQVDGHSVQPTTATASKRKSKKRR
ncbi:MAG TPA: hypothetical protein VHD56_00800 [Tepidisphaeraceae bacterium]|nr:hypothetical protein [Tepidisphaeraceae bacterium]